MSPDIDTKQISLYKNTFPQRICTTLFNKLYQEIPWSQPQITLFGKTHPIPRQQCWMGDEHASYSYSNLQMKPKPWTDTVTFIKRFVETICNTTFNSVLINLYRDGNDSNGWHSDNEKELGTHPLIASFNLGESRAFKLKNKTTKELYAYQLDAGDLLIMKKGVQAEWLHTIPKTKKVKQPRINLTFRSIYSEPDRF